MQKLDWYILKKFLVTFFFCLILFTTIAVAVAMINDLGYCPVCKKIHGDHEHPKDGFALNSATNNKETSFV